MCYCKSVLRYLKTQTRSSLSSVLPWLLPVACFPWAAPIGRGFAMKHPQHYTLLNPRHKSGSKWAKWVIELCGEKDYSLRWHLARFRGRTPPPHAPLQIPQVQMFVFRGFFSKCVSQPSSQSRDRSVEALQRLRVSTLSRVSPHPQVCGSLPSAWSPGGVKYSCYTSTCDCFSSQCGGEYG